MGVTWEHNIEIFKFSNNRPVEEMNLEVQKWKENFKSTKPVILEIRANGHGKFFYIIVHYKI